MTCIGCIAGIMSDPAAHSWPFPASNMLKWTLKLTKGKHFMKKKLISIGLGVLLLFFLLFGSYKIMVSRSFQLFGGLTDHVETNEKVVALTFDDGPTEKTEQLLPLLDRYNVKATLFLIGSDIEENPEEAKNVVNAGYQIGNHTYSHQRMVLKSPSFIKNEIEKTDKLIREAGYQGKIDFRPPYGKKFIGLPYYLNKHNRSTITWDLEPDSYYSTAADKVKYVKENVKPGSIILMHPWYDKSGEEIEAIKGIIETLTKEGYKFVTVEELMQLEK